MRDTSLLSAVDFDQSPLGALLAAAGEWAIVGWKEYARSRPSDWEQAQAVMRAGADVRVEVTLGPPPLRAQLVLIARDGSRFLLLSGIAEQRDERATPGSSSLN